MDALLARALPADSLLLPLGPSAELRRGGDPSWVRLISGIDWPETQFLGGWSTEPGASSRGSQLIRGLSPTADPPLLVAAAARSGHLSRWLWAPLYPQEALMSS